MKIKITALAILTAALSYGQEFGIKAGLNVNALRINDLTEGTAESTTGYHAGVFANFPVTSKFAVQPELLYSQDGGKYELLRYMDVPLRYTTEIKTQNISIPVMFQYRIMSRIYAEAGPEFNIIVGKNAKISELTQQITPNLIQNSIKDQLKNFNFGLGIGAGVDIISGLGVNLRYVAGLSNISSDDQYSTIRSNHFQAGVYYKF